MLKLKLLFYKLCWIYIFNENYIYIIIIYYLNENI